MKVKLLIVLILSLTQISAAQFENYGYRREIRGVSETWHKIVLPDEIFSKTSASLSDLRIIGVAENNETVEVPYILRQPPEVQDRERDIEFKLINQSHNTDGYFYTFEIPSEKPINQIELKFDEPNFDLQVTLEGSQNQQEWFTVIENYRILSIKNNLTDYSFTTLKFPNAKFRYFRLRVAGDKNPDFASAKITERQADSGVYKQFPIKNFSVNEDKKAKQTVIDIELPMIVPVSLLKINVKDDFDFYRPLTIKYLAENAQMPKGLKPIYQTVVSSGVLSSLETREFKFTDVKTDRLQITIDNRDNQPLNFDSCEVKGKQYELDARFTPVATARYYLIYGNRQAVQPNYDIANFKEKIPPALAELSLGDEEPNPALQTSPAAAKPLFQNPAWLWVVMITAILLLGWFSIKMLRNKS